MSKNKKIVVVVSVVLSLAIVFGAVVFVKVYGEAILFAVTNKNQVLQEKQSWNDYINNYPVGKE